MINNFPKGQAALLSVLLVFVMGFLTVDGVSNLTIGNIKTTSDIKASAQAYYAAEAALEEALLRNMDDDYDDPSSVSVSLNGIEATATVVADGQDFNIETSIGNETNRHRKVAAKLTKQLSTADFSAGVQAGEGGLNLAAGSTITGDVYSNGPIDGAGAEVFGNVEVKTGFTSGLTLDSSQVAVGSSKIFGKTTLVEDIAQPFTVSQSGKSLARVEFFLSKVGSPSDIKVRIAANNGGKPATTDLVAGNFYTLTSKNVNTTAAWITATFENPIAVNAGTTYWIVIDSGTSTNNYWLAWHDGNAAGLGATSRNWSNASYSWTPIGGNLAHRIYLSVPGEVPNTVKKLEATGYIYADRIIDGSIANSEECPNPTNDKCGDSSFVGRDFPITSENIIEFKCQASGQSYNVETNQCVGDASLECSEANYCDASGNLDLIKVGSNPIGPIVIPGNISINTGNLITLSGPVWVKGRVNLNNQAEIELKQDKQEYLDGKNEVMLVGTGEPGASVDDGNISCNKCHVTGPGDSNLLFISLKNDITNSGAIDFNSPNAEDALFFAPNSGIRIDSNGIGKAAVGYKVTFTAGAAINYDSALSDFATSSGFSAFTWIVEKWREIF